MDNRWRTGFFLLALISAISLVSLRVQLNSVRKDYALQRIMDLADSQTFVTIKTGKGEFGFSNIVPDQPFFSPDGFKVSFRYYAKDEYVLWVNENMGIFYRPDAHDWTIWVNDNACSL